MNPDTFASVTKTYTTMKRQKKTVVFLLAMTLAGFSGLQAQTATGGEAAPSRDVKAEYKSSDRSMTLSGTVLDENGEPLIGATVMIQGSLIGTTTGGDGDFSLKNVRKGDVLRIAFVGYQTQEIVVKDNSVLTLHLKPSAASLNEVVVVGYGSQKKSDITGAVTNIKSDALNQAPVGNIGSALQGLASGMDVQMAGGNTHPGATPTIRIRGERSLRASNDVLIVVDGVPFSGNLNEINNDDVESISVLKDASDRKSVV